MDSGRPEIIATAKILQLGADNLSAFIQTVATILIIVIHSAVYKYTINFRSYHFVIIEIHNHRVCYL